MTPKISTQDYLFLQFGKLVVELREVCQIYYPHLKPSQISKKASVQDFPFPCFRLADSQKSPYFVHIGELAQALDKEILPSKLTTQNFMHNLIKR